MNCPVCNIDKIAYSLSFANNIVLRCQSCSSEFLENYKESRSHLYSQSYYDSWNLKEETTATEIIKHMTFKILIGHLEKKCNGLKSKKLLDIGCATGFMLDVAREKGCEVYGVELSTWACDQAKKKHTNVFNKTLEECKFKSNFFDIVSMTDVLEHIDSPHVLFKELNRIVSRGGHILITVPDSLSWTKKIMGKRWFQFKDEHLIYYNKKALSHIGNQYGFEILDVKNNRKVMCIGYLNTQFMSYKVPFISEFLGALNKIIPNSWRNFPFKLPLSGEIMAILKKN